MSENAPPPLPKPTTVEELTDPRFLHAADLKGRNVTVTIEAVDMEYVTDEKGKTLAGVTGKWKKKGIISFRGKDKQFIPNVTNALCLQALFGGNPQEWVGHQVTLMPTTVVEAGPLKGKPCIRIYGSPELEQDMHIEIKLPRKKNRPWTLHAVTKSPPSAPPASSVTAAQVDSGAATSGPPGAGEEGTGLSPPSSPADSHRKITAKEHKALEARITKIGINREAVKAWVDTQWDVQHFPDLTRDQYQELDAYLDEVAADLPE